MVSVGILHGWYTLRRRRVLRTLAVRHLWLGFIVFVAAMIGLRLGSVSANLSCVWIANGLYIGFVLCTNARRRFELLPIGLAVNYLANRLGQLPPGDSLGFALGDLVQIFVTIYPFRRVPASAINLAQLQGFLKVGVYATIAGAAAGTMVIALWMHFILGAPTNLPFYASWFCSDMVGAAVTIPLYWYSRRKPRLERVALYKYDVQYAFFFFCAVAVGLFWQTRFPLLFLLFPVLIPVVYASGFVGAAWAVLVTTMVGVVATAYGHGPLMLVHASAEGRVYLLQFYLFVVLITAFPFAAMMMERQQLLSVLRASEIRYRELARLDGLTQLPNRREFDSFLDISRQRSVRQNTPLSLLLIDIDHFKKLNDQHGHTVGDEYLRKMAVAVASAVPRKTDLVARYGGEEFAVVLDSCDDSGAMLVAERIQAAVAKLCGSLVAQNRPPVTVSIGVATTLPNLRTPSKVLIDAADQGLYTAKRNGRNRTERGTDLIADGI